MESDCSPQREARIVNRQKKADAQTAKSTVPAVALWMIFRVA
jgi:hypothetical protein